MCDKFCHFNVEMLLVDLQIICLGGLDWSKRTVNKHNQQLIPYFKKELLWSGFQVSWVSKVIFVLHRDWLKISRYFLIQSEVSNPANRGSFSVPTTIRAGKVYVNGIKICKTTATNRWECPLLKLRKLSFSGKPFLGARSYKIVLETILDQLIPRCEPFDFWGG